MDTPSEFSKQLCHISITWPENVSREFDDFLIERRTSDWLVSRERSLEIWRMLVTDYVDAAKEGQVQLVKKEEA